MSVAAKLRSSAKPVPEPGAALGPTRNRVRVLEDTKRKSGISKKQRKVPPKRPTVAPEIPDAAVKKKFSADSSCSSDSSSSSSSCSFSSGGSLGKMARYGRNVKRNEVSHVKVVADGGEFMEKQERPVMVRRCDWITPNSDPLYASFHDEEWGVPVHDDRKLFELLVFSQALGELSWPSILHMRDIFRKHLDNFNPLSIAEFSDKKLLSLKMNGNLLLSEPKLRAIVENAKLMLKVQQEFGSFSNYCWRFVNHKPLRNGFRYARQVPVRTPKAELISKDMMQRGFRCVGPTVVYSFMQVAGIVNDHLLTCFRYQDCKANVKKDFKPEIEETEAVTKALENTCHLKSELPGTPLP